MPPSFLVMERSLEKRLCVSLVLFLFGIHGCLGCFEEERIALLEMKTFLDWTVAGSVDYAKESDCCDWEPAIIKCSATTGRVVQLFLGGINLMDGNKNGTYLNVTIFSTFKELQHLDLSDNLFGGWIEDEGFERLAGLRKLEFLDLSRNFFNTTILPSLGSITSLRTLSLAINNLGGTSSASSHWAGLANLHNLQLLDLSYNSLEASMETIQGFKSFGELQSLKVLLLDGNNFNNSILQSLGTLKSLSKLTLPFNHLDGSSHFTDLCKLKNLHELDLSWNNFEGILPPCLNNLTALTSLDLSHNQFNGNITSLISSLKSLVNISLSYNNFDGMFPFISFANNSNLEVIDLRFAGDKLKVEIDYLSWQPPSQLKVLLLSNINLSQHTNTFPGFLNNQHNLRFLDLSSNNLKGMFPNWLLENNKLLEVLMLRNNCLSGHFVPPSYVHQAVFKIDISSNCFGGLLDANLGKMFPNVEYFNLSQNFFQGRIPSSIADMGMLFILDLSNNNFSGAIPLRLAKACNSLEVLRLSNNKLHGQILPPHSNWTHLISLRLDNNSFTGNILTGLSTCFGLQILDIGNNKITGRIPNWIGNFTQLSLLNLEGNFLQGNIPVEFCNLQVYFLDLSNNFLSGSIPSILNSTSLQYLHLQRNRFTRLSHPPSPFTQTSLLTLDIKDNEFNSIIPNWICSLSKLEVLLLKQNHFTGPIPNCFCQMAFINIMDLSHNALSGSIPACLNNISFGRRIDMDLSFVRTITSYAYTSISNGDPNGSYDNYNGDELGTSEEVDFVTKSISYPYKGDILSFLSGLDLSCNYLSNDIPSEIESLNSIFALNLSHNQLTGPIPRTMSNLSQIESLDLSYNKLNGEIPSELSILNSLAVFTVAHNNLSGKTPEMKAQFGTFTSTSYEGNPFLCGPPLPRNCSSDSKQSTNTSTRIPSSIADKNEDDSIDMGGFIASFVGSYLVFLLGIAAVLYINPYWRRMWFHFIDQCINSTREFVSDTWYRFVTRACT